MPELVKVMHRDPLDVPYLRIVDFAAVINCSPSQVRILISAGKLHAAKDGKATKIRETPRAYLDSLPDWQPGTMKAGPGRPRRQQVQPSA